MLILTVSPGISGFAAETPGEGSEPVPLYTNADLARLAPPAAAPEAVPDSQRGARSSQEDWEMVQRFLDREYARIDAERAAERENRMIDQAEDTGDSEHGVWSYPGVWPDYYSGYGYDYGYGSVGPRRYLADQGYRVLPSSLGSRIIQGGHGRYSRMQGSDAFPGAAGPPAGQPKRHGHGNRAR